MCMAVKMRCMIGTEMRMSSGVFSLCALYAGNASLLKVSPCGSNATARYVGFSFEMTSCKVLQNPMMAEVLAPLELILGFLMKA